MKRNRKTHTLMPALGLAMAVAGPCLAGENDGAGGTGGAAGDGSGSGLFGGALGGAVAGNSAPSGWELTGATGLSLAQGNADSVAYSVQASSDLRGSALGRARGSGLLFCRK